MCLTEHRTTFSVSVHSFDKVSGKYKSETTNISKYKHIYVPSILPISTKKTFFWLNYLNISTCKTKLNRINCKHLCRVHIYAHVPIGQMFLNISQ